MHALLKFLSAEAYKKIVQKMEVKTITYCHLVMFEPLVCE